MSVVRAVGVSGSYRFCDEKLHGGEQGFEGSKVRKYKGCQEQEQVGGQDPRAAVPE